MKRTAYIDTSVISYLTARPSRDLVAAALQELTRQWWSSRDRYLLFVSPVVLRECSGGDPLAVVRRAEALVGIPSLAVTDEIEDVALQLVEGHLLPDKAADDALHIAIAAVHRIDILLTWNCTHIANPLMREPIRSSLVARGLSAPTICTPGDLLQGELNA